MSLLRYATLGGDKFRDEYSLAFDGTNDYVELSGTFNYNIHSISIWLKETTASAQSTVFDHRDGNNDGINFYLTSGQPIYAVNNVDAHYTSAIDLNKWSHIVLTNDGSTSTIYINGVSVQTADTSGETINISSSAVARFGRVITGNYFTGNLSEAAIYDKALSASQVKTLYNGREPYNHKEGVASSNLKGWWRMGDGSIDKFNLVGDEVNATLGSDLITDGGFDGDGSAWTVDNFSIGSGVATTSTNGASIQQSLSISTGDMIKIVAEIKNYTSGSIRYYTGSGADVSRSFSSDGVHTHYLIANSTKVLFYSDNFNGSIDNVKVYKVNGNAGAMINMASDDFTGDTP